MRKLQECQAEVFRRSEKRIQARKRRGKRLLIACVPLVLCATVLGVFLRPAVTQGDMAEPGDMPPVMDGMGSGEDMSISCPIARITVSGSGVSRSYTREAELLGISDMLYACGVQPPASNGAGSEDIPDQAPQDGTEVLQEDDENTAYTITVFTVEGERTEYRLCGGTLENLTANQTFPLSQTQEKELRELLGIPLR